VTLVQQPLTSFAEDVTATRRTSAPAIASNMPTARVMLFSFIFVLLFGKVRLQDMKPAFVGGAGWRPVYDRLTQDGYHVTLVQQPLTSFAEDRYPAHGRQCRPDPPLCCRYRLH
jgi:hypothetical protein